MQLTFISLDFVSPHLDQQSRWSRPHQHHHLDSFLHIRTDYRFVTESCKSTLPWSLTVPMPVSEPTNVELQILRQAPANSMSSATDTSEGPSSKKPRVEQPPSESKLKPGDVAILRIPQSKDSISFIMPPDDEVYRLGHVKDAKFDQDAKVWMYTVTLAEKKQLKSREPLSRSLSKKGRLRSVRTRVERRSTPCTLSVTILALEPLRRYGSKMGISSTGLSQT